MTPVAILLLAASLAQAQNFQPYKFEKPDPNQYFTSFEDTHSKQERSGVAALPSEQSRTHVPAEADPADPAQLQHRTRRVRKEQVPAPTTNATQAARKGVRRKSSQAEAADTVQSKWSSLMNTASSNHQRSEWPADELTSDEYDGDYSYMGGLPEDEEIESARSKAKTESASTGRSAGASTATAAAAVTPSKRRSSAPADKKSGGGRIRPKKGHADESYDDAYYDDDYYYDSVEGRREGGGYGASSSSYGGGGGGVSPLALLVAPLAGIALLTAAAAVALNPVLVNISLASGRKKRDARKIDAEVEEKIEEMKVLEDFLGKVPRNDSYQQKVLSMYLTCSGFTEDTNLCLERVVCEYAHPKSSLAKEERDVISIVLYHIMGNPYVENVYKDRLKVAARLGKNPDVTCKVKFPCSRLDANHF